MELEYRVGRGKEDFPFEGTVMLKMLSRKERYQHIKSMAFSVSEEGKVEASPDKAIDYMEKLVDLVSDRVSSMNIKHKASGLEFDSLDGLECYKEGDELISDIGSVLINGLSLGET